LFENYLESIFINKYKDCLIKTFDEVAIIKGGKRPPKGEKLSRTKTKHP